MIDVLVSIGVVIVVLYALDASVLGLMANQHRRRVSNETWARAQVSRLRWGFLGTNIYIPFSNIYYVLRVIPVLEKAAANGDGHAPSG